MGNGQQDLQLTLLRKYLELLIHQNDLPAVYPFYTEGSPVIDKLKALEDKDVRLVVCSTCLNYFGLTDKVKNGIVGGMGDIIEAQWRTGKVITL